MPTGDPRDRDSLEFARAAALARSRGSGATLVFLGSSLGANNGGGLKWLRNAPSVSTVVVVDPNLPDSDRAEWKGDDSVFARLSTTCAITGTLACAGGTCVENFLVVRETADAFATRLASRLGLDDRVAAAAARARASTIFDDRPLPDVLVGGRNDHGFTARVRAAFSRPERPAGAAP